MILVEVIHVALIIEGLWWQKERLSSSSSSSSSISKTLPSPLATAAFWFLVCFWVELVVFLFFPVSDHLQCLPATWRSTPSKVKTRSWERCRSKGPMSKSTWIEGDVTRTNSKSVSEIFIEAANVFDPLLNFPVWATFDDLAAWLQLGATPSLELTSCSIFRKTMSSRTTSTIWWPRSCQSMTWQFRGDECVILPHEIFTTKYRRPWCVVARGSRWIMAVPFTMKLQ